MAVINLDWYLASSPQHPICEDYALTGASPQPYLIVCDGCSSSTHTDVGARIMAWSAKRILEQITGDASQPFPTYHDFGAAVAEHARASVTRLGAPLTCLDATLLVASVYADVCTVAVYGDGYVGSQDGAGQMTLRRVAYRQNMPYYLSYWHDEARRDCYVAAQSGGATACTVTTELDNVSQSAEQPYNAPLTWTFPLAETRLVTIASDGVAALLDQAQNQAIPARVVMTDLLAYKTTKGEFVKRRAKRMLKEYEKNGVALIDDLAVATLLLA